MVRCAMGEPTPSLFFAKEHNGVIEYVDVPPHGLIGHVVGLIADEFTDVGRKLIGSRQRGKLPLISHTHGDDRQFALQRACLIRLSAI